MESARKPERVKREYRGDEHRDDRIPDEIDNGSRGAGRRHHVDRGRHEHEEDRQEHGEHRDAKTRQRAIADGPVDELRGHWPRRRRRQAAREPK
jgi:hypothetical protein